MKAFHEAAEVVAKESMKSAAKEVKHFYETEGHFVYDKKRGGFSSTVCTWSCISLITGKVLDVEVMSKESRECINLGRLMRRPRNLSTSKMVINTNANFKSSSGAMDAVGGVRIFEQYELQYLEFVGDGDNKACNELTEVSVQGGGGEELPDLNVLDMSKRE